MSSDRQAFSVTATCSPFPELLREPEGRHPGCCLLRCWPSTSMSRSSTSPYRASPPNCTPTPATRWVVDGYNPHLRRTGPGGKRSLSDRYGRRPAPIIGLLGLLPPAPSGACRQHRDVDRCAVQYGCVRCADLFPTTLSIITNTFSDRRQRANGTRRMGSWSLASGSRPAQSPAACSSNTLHGTACSGRSPCHTSWRRCSHTCWCRNHAIPVCLRSISEVHHLDRLLGMLVSHHHRGPVRAGRATPRCSAS